MSRQFCKTTSLQSVIGEKYLRGSLKIFISFSLPGQLQPWHLNWKQDDPLIKQSHPELGSKTPEIRKVLKNCVWCLSWILLSQVYQLMLSLNVGLTNEETITVHKNIVIWYTNSFRGKLSCFVLPCICLDSWLCKEGKQSLRHWHWCFCWFSGRRVGLQWWSWWREREGRRGNCDVVHSASPRPWDQRQDYLHAHLLRLEKQILCLKNTNFLL